MSFAILASLVKPITELVDKVHTSEEERGNLRLKLFELQSTLAAKFLEYEGKLVQAKADVIKAEATGQSWLQRNWRPTLMISIVAIVVNNYLLLPYAVAFGLPIVPLELPPELFTLMTVGVGGYIVGRSGEKIANQIKWGAKE